VLSEFGCNDIVVDGRGSASEEIRDVLKNEVERANPSERFHVSAPKCISGVTRPANAEIRETLTRGSSYHDVRRRYTTTEAVGDVSHIKIGAGVVGRVGRRGMIAVTSDAA
jgi:hypothetical protein